MLSAIVTGAAGRMGGEIIQAINGTGGISVVGGVERPGHPMLGQDVGLVAGVGELGVALTDDLEASLKAGDVVIDFTSAETSMANFEIVKRLGKSLVIGSTGFTMEQKETIRAVDGGARIFLAPNMSIGMNVLFKLVEDVSRLLGEEYDIEIVEAHHRFKKDAPSGSATRLAEAAAAGRSADLEEVGVWGRKGIIGERQPGEIGVHAVRGGDVVGDHMVLFAALGERLELTHKASSRQTFARGAVRASLWMSEKEPGCYDMLDLLGLKYNK